MANLPGLTPFREDAPQGLQRDKKTIGLDPSPIRVPNLRPQAAPLDTYARPAKPVADDTTARLADALGAINPALQRFGTAYMQDQKSDVESSVQAKLSTAGSPEAVQKLLKEDPEVQTEIGGQAAMRFMGKRLAAEAVQKANDAYANGFDKQNGNIDGLVAQTMKPYIDQYGGNKHFRQAFMEDVTPGMDRLRAGFAQQKTQDTYQQNQQDTSDVFLGVVRKGEASGQSADDQAKAVFAEFYGNKKLLGLSYPDQMKALGQVVQTLANEGKYDVVKSLAEMDRNSPDGGHVGKLLDNNIVGPGIAAQVLHAKQVRDTKTHEATIETRQSLFDKFSQGQATPEDENALKALVRKNDGMVSESTADGWIAHNRTKRQALQKAAADEAAQASLDAKLNAQESAITNTGIEAMKSGKLFSLPQQTLLKKDGSEEVLTPEKNREKAIDNFGKWSNQYAQQKGETWEQKTLRELPVYASNGVVPKDWKDTFSSGGNAISAAVTNGTDLPEPAQKAYAMYKLLRANDAQMLRDLVPKDQADLYEAWRVGEEELHVDPRKALIAANTMNADPSNYLNRAGLASAKQIKDAVKDAKSGMWSRLWGDSAPGNLPDNGSDIADKIGRRAEWYAGLGLGVDAALKAARESVSKTHVSVNGWWIDASDKRLPKEFPALAGDMIGQYVAKHGKAEGIGADDLTIREVGTGYGAWRIVRKSDGIPVDDPNDAIFTSNDLMSALHSRKEAEDRKTLEKMRGNAERGISSPFPTQ